MIENKNFKRLIILLITFFLASTLFIISSSATDDQPVIKTEEGFSGSYSTFATDVVWDNGMNWDFGASSQYFTNFMQYSIIADDFAFGDPTDVTDVHWIGGYYNGYNNEEFDWEIIFYEDLGGIPGPVFAGPFTYTAADAHESYISDNGYAYYFNYWVDLPSAVTFSGGQKYWISIQGIGAYPPQSMWAMHYSPIMLDYNKFESDLFSVIPWQDYFFVDCAFQLTSCPSEVWVDDDFDPSTPGWGCNHFDTIQDGVDAVCECGTVYVAEGTYTETVTINQSMKLIATGDATIVCPPTVDGLYVEESTKYYQYLIGLLGGTYNGGTDTVEGTDTITVEVSGFTLDANQFIPTQRWSTILCRNVNDDHCNDISWIHDNELLNNYVNGKETFGILGYGDMNVIIENNLVDQFARGGIGLYSGYAETISNTVQGPGLGVPVTWAPNGIQYGYGAQGIIDDNDVSGCGWPGTAWAGTGIMIVDTSYVTVSNNHIHDNEQACAVIDYPGAYGPPWDARTVSHILVEENDFYYNEWGLSIVNDAYDIDVFYNRFWNTTYDAIDVYAYDQWYTWYTDPAPREIDINHNWIRHELCLPPGVGLWVGSTVSNVVDARYNYWGQDDGPSGNTLDIYTGRLADDTGGEEVQGINVSFDEYAGVCADFSVSDSTPAVGDPVIFDASASYAVDIDGSFYTPDSYQWDVYKNGQYQFTLFGETATKVFMSPGAYKVRLRVRASDATLNYWGDTSGSLLDDEFMMITISSVKDPLKVDACPDDMFDEAKDHYEGELDSIVQFYSVVTGGVPDYEYLWDFGDGYTADVPNPQHTYVQSGEYTVRLTVTDAEGTIASDETMAVIIESGDGPDNPDDYMVEILSAKGGFGVKVDVKNDGAESVDWSIELTGDHIYFGSISEGIIPANTEKTLSTGFVLGFGDVDIKISVGKLIQSYSARMFGPFVLSMEQL